MFRWFKWLVPFILLLNSCKLVEDTMTTKCNNLDDLHYSRSFGDYKIRLAGPKRVCNIHKDKNLFPYALRLQIYNSSQKPFTVVHSGGSGYVLNFRNTRFWEVGYPEDWSYISTGPIDFEKITEIRKVVKPGDVYEHSGDERYMSTMQGCMVFREAILEERIIRRASPRTFGLRFEYGISLIMDGQEIPVSGTIETQTLFELENPTTKPL